jgi:hypothetical protein
VKWPCMSTGKRLQHMPLLGDAMAGGLVSGVKGRHEYLYDHGIYERLTLDTPCGSPGFFTSALIG